jgi:hypothetical protein
MKTHRCWCRKFRGIKFRGILCPRCGTEVSLSPSRPASYFRVLVNWIREILHE